MKKKLKNQKKHETLFKKFLSLIKKKKRLGKGLKILTQDQMLSRLPITLAQSKAGNNSEKRKNEIRQLLYSLY